MANSIAFVLSKNTYPDAYQANLIGVDQGTQIVYATTSTLTSANILYADSKLTQPIYGNVDDWYGVQLLTNDSVKYAISISDTGSVQPISNPTTTTTSAPATSTTTGGVTTYSELYSLSAFYSCTTPVTEYLTFYSASPILTAGASVFENNSLTTPVELGYVILKNSVRYFVGENGVLSIYNCPAGTSTTASPTTSTTTATPVVSFEFEISDRSSLNDACGRYDAGLVGIFYSSVSPLADGAVLSINPGLTPVVLDGYYSDGINSWQVTGGNGTLTNQTPC